MVRGQDPIRHHVRRQIRQSVMAKPAPHTRFLTVLLLLLRGIARFLTVQAGALFSLSHRRLQARASVDDAPMVRPQQRNCQLCTDSDRLPARQTIQMAQRWTIARPSPTRWARFAPRRVPMRGALCFRSSSCVVLIPRLRPPAQLRARVYGFGPSSGSSSDPKGAKIHDRWWWEDGRGRVVHLIAGD
jgi:hypothetical protein